MCFNYSEVDMIDKLIDEASNNFDTIHEKQKKCLTIAKMPSANLIIDNFMKY